MQAYALIGREDIAATLAPSGLEAGAYGPGMAAAAAAKRRQQQEQADAALQLAQTQQQQQQQQPAATAAPSHTHPQRPPTADLGRPPLHPPATSAAAAGATARASNTSVASLLLGREVPPLRTFGAEPHAAADSSQPDSAATCGSGSPAAVASLFSFRHLAHPSPGAATPTASGAATMAITPYGSTPQQPPTTTGFHLSYNAATPLPYATPAAAAAAAASSLAASPSIPSRYGAAGGTGGAAAAGRRGLPPPLPPPRPPPSHRWHLWRPAYTARLQLPSHQLDLGAELEARRRLEGAAKQFESKHGMEGLTRGKRVALSR